MKVIFMGTPDFAVEILKTLHQSEFEIPAVITVADKAAGRGKKIRKSAVKTYAEENMDCDILQPINLKSEEFTAQLAAYNADLFVVVAFRMLPKTVWSMPPMGTINLHASLLPQYRGAAPINWAIINGEQKTGVTTFFIQEEIDTGDILHQEKVTIAKNTTAGELHDELMYLGANVVLQTVKDIAQKNVKAIPQEKTLKNIGEVKSAPKIFKDTCKVDWSKPAQEIHNHIRGLSPYPAAWTEIENGKGERISMKLFKSEISALNLNVGEIKTDNKTYITIGTGTTSVNLTEIQLAGKKRMLVSDFLRGYTFDSNVEMT